jgi:hypothetical protein
VDSNQKTIIVEGFVAAFAKAARVSDVPEEAITRDTGESSYMFLAAEWNRSTVSERAYLLAMLFGREFEVETNDFSLQIENLAMMMLEPDGSSLLSRAPTSPRRRTAGREPGRRTEGAPAWISIEDLGRRLRLSVTAVSAECGGYARIMSVRLQNSWRPRRMTSAVWRSSAFIAASDNMLICRLYIPTRPSRNLCPFSVSRI